MSQSTLTDLSSVRVLCVDDDPVIRSVIRSALQRRGCRDVVQANGGMDALDLCAGRTFDLVICDVQMHPMNGLDFLRALANSELGAGWPVIMLSAETNPATIQEAQELGISAWVGKPVSVMTLIERVSTVLCLRGQIAGAPKDGELSAMSDRHHARLMAALTTAETTANSLSFRAREAASLAHGMRNILAAIDEHARALGYGLVTMLASRAADLAAAMVRDPPAATRSHAATARALSTLITAMKRVAHNRMEGDGAEAGLKLLEKIDGIVDPVRAGFG
jgi:two-component system chemotaxis response regulator CheY